MAFTLPLPRASTSATPTLVTRGTEDKIQTFIYRARNVDGKVVTGNAKAVSRADVTRALMRENLVPLMIKGGAAGSLFAADSGFRKTAKRRDLVVASRMLAAMVDADLSHLDAIDIVRKDIEDPLLASALNEARIAMTDGATLARALEAQEPVFPAKMINLLIAGEARGEIKQALNRVADEMEKEDRLVSKVRKAMMQPMILLVLSGAIFSAMMLFLVPMFAQTFVDLGGPGTQLPFLTRVVLAASNVTKWVAPALILLAVPALIVYRRNRHKDGVREVVDPLKLKIPVFGGLFHKIAIARFTYSLSSMLAAGVDQLLALEITAKTCGNIAMERAILKARDAQRNGRSLVDPLREEPLFPNRVIQMTEAGENSGRTAFMLDKANALYERDVDQITDNLAELITPLFVVVLGAMIGIVVIALYLPYTHLVDVIDP